MHNCPLLWCCTIVFDLDTDLVFLPTQERMLLNAFLIFSHDRNRHFLWLTSSSTRTVEVHVGSRARVEFQALAFLFFSHYCCAWRRRSSSFSSRSSSLFYEIELNHRIIDLMITLSAIMITHPNQKVNVIRPKVFSLISPRPHGIVKPSTVTVASFSTSFRILKERRIPVHHKMSHYLEHMVCNSSFPLASLWSKMRYKTMIWYPPHKDRTLNDGQF